MGRSERDTLSSRREQTQDVHLCELASIPHGGAGGESDLGRSPKARKRPDWPFLYTYEDGVLYINRIKRRSAYEQACDLGEADM